MGHAFAKALVLATAALGPATAGAEDNLQNLSQLAPARLAEFTAIEQTGAYADQIRRTLEGITLPKGFTISLYAIVPGARQMAGGPQGRVTFVGTQNGKVWAVTDQNGDGAADDVIDFAPSVDFTIPNGVCFANDGQLFVVE
ncbi:MAG: sorbosone dehydrogenase, partial [Hyphomicrobiales bacterium]